MARCSYHPDVETELTCTECGKPICPREMVQTPVGYKCPEDARAARSQYVYLKPAQAVRAAVAALAVGLAGAALLAFVGFGGLLGGLLWGLLAAEVVRRASGGHRGSAVAGIAAAGIGVGWLASLPLGGLWIVTPIAAAVVAFFQLGGFPAR